MEKASAYKDMSILFDFDGTIGDTETPAMEVAFWELAPYFPKTSEPLIKDRVSFFCCKIFIENRREKKQNGSSLYP